MDCESVNPMGCVKGGREGGGRARRGEAGSRRPLLLPNPGSVRDALDLILAINRRNAGKSRVTD